MALPRCATVNGGMVAWVGWRRACHSCRATPGCSPSASSPWSSREGGVRNRFCSETVPGPWSPLYGVVERRGRRAVSMRVESVEVPDEDVQPGCSGFLLEPGRALSIGLKRSQSSVVRDNGSRHPRTQDPRQKVNAWPRRTTATSRKSPAGAAAGRWLAGTRSRASPEHGVAPSGLRCPRSSKLPHFGRRSVPRVGVCLDHPEEIAADVDANDEPQPNRSGPGGRRGHDPIRFFTDGRPMRHRRRPSPSGGLDVRSHARGGSAGGGLPFPVPNWPGLLKKDGRW